MNAANPNHPFDALPGEWFACEHPERPHDRNTWVHFLCRGCVLSLGAAAIVEPDVLMAEHDDMTREALGSELDETLADLYERFRHAFGLPPLPITSLSVAGEAHTPHEKNKSDKGETE